MSHFIIVITIVCLCIFTREARSGNEVFVNKCCGLYERLDTTHRRCVGADWAQNASISWAGFGYLKAPFDQQWLSRWFPPGLPLQYIKSIRHSTRTHNKQSAIVPVNTSLLWDKVNNQTVLPSDTVVFYFISIVREGIGRNITVFSSYCVDATSNDSSKYALVFSTQLSDPKITYKCCREGFLLVAKRGSLLECRQDHRGWWSPYNSSMKSHLHQETPYSISPWTTTRHLYEWKPQPLSKIFVDLMHRKVVETSFSVSDTCADFKLDEDGTLKEVLAYFYTSRYTRGVYWLARNMSFASILLLVVALAVIIWKMQMRHWAHDWALACHVSCLLLFNVGQVGYYLGISGDVDPIMLYVPERLVGACLGFSFTMYFLLTAAASWLSAVCMNMTYGFTARGLLARYGGSERKRFLWLSLFAWGIPVLLTAISVSVFLTQSTVMRQVTYVQGMRQPLVSYQGPWYRPSFVETRTCFDELIICHTKGRRRTMLQCGLSIAKGGSLLYYYGPICALVLVNVVALSLTARRVHELRRGNSILRRDDKEGGGKGEGAEGETAVKKLKKGKNGASDAQSMTVYIKLLLTAGLLEIVTELCAWATSTVMTDPKRSDTSDASNVLDHTQEY